MSKYGLKPGERLAGAVMYVEEWCDGNGNLGPCSCSDTASTRRGHWRGGRKIELSELLQRVAEAQREVSAQYLDDLLRKKEATAIWVGADEMRQAPLATDHEEKP